MSLTHEQREVPRDVIVACEPTHVMEADGSLRAIEPPTPPTEEVWRYLEEEPAVLFTGVVWREMNSAQRIDFLRQHQIPIAKAGANDVLDVLPETTKRYLLFWQGQINSGSCWMTSGHIGRHAAGLIDDGFCLLSNKPLKNYWGSNVPARTDVSPGSPGSPAYIGLIMSPLYLNWIGALI